MPYVFIIAAIYCVILAIRRFTGKNPPAYIAKDPTITGGQVEQWRRCNGYSMLLWAGFSATMAALMMFGHWAIIIPLVVFAALGFLFAMKGSFALRDKSGKYDKLSRETTNNKSTASRKKHKKKKKKTK